MNCPYSDLECAAATVPSESRRCQCGRRVKRCACGMNNRAFANFCRSCGERLRLDNANWTGSRGSSRRLGFNPHDPGPKPLFAKVPLTLQLGSECRALLAYDGHLLAVSHDGVVEVADAGAGKSVCRFQVQGPVTAAPCIHSGILYLAAAKQLSAYSLGALTQGKPRVRAIWTVPLNGTPIHALTPVADRLYTTIASPSWREVQVIEDLARPSPRTAFSANRTSGLAADESNAYCFSQNDGEPMHLQIAGASLDTRPVSLHPVPEHPIAVLGGAIFGIFGDAHRLYRMEAATGIVEEALDEDVQFFALSASDAEWDRDLVVIDTAGIRFSHAAVRDAFGQHDRAVKGSPVIMSNAAALVGMEDGRVRIYNLAQLPRHEMWLVGDGNSAITALASFDNYVAAGNGSGIVELRETRTRKGSAA